ncbi:TetR/AcrR family transcriptional regulator [Azospirillum picis]|uniref:AcrR family transcriptional regulator n=1 Tax=Azospirillum picis TaxID=488438 RepID=A0ABU0MQQ7_9PROT|nr:TetR/AcrR family transcriptional regulator [Azospirillum picis]MBP2302228.1 AcrR family transcriptional regulator [Azospirillum picis]MDQ0535807.1 AcrR family transcriptional regulator [Azospirillum picis]
MTNVKNNRGRGRPPAFDRATVLERAMQVFWASGYDGASIPMLTEAMGISAQSLYAAFDSKEALYREAIEFYSRTIGGYAAQALEDEGDAIEAVARLLRESAETFARTTGTPGCMISTTPFDAANTPLALLGREMRAASVRLVEARLLKGIEDGQVSGGLDAHGWARYIGSVVQGMSVQARDGASAADLMDIARITADSLRSHRAGTGMTAAS